MSEKKIPMVLISHSTADKEYAKLIIALFEHIGLNSEQMVCSSVPGYGVPLNKKVYE